MPHRMTSGLEIIAQRLNDEKERDMEAIIIIVLVILLLGGGELLVLRQTRLSVPRPSKAQRRSPFPEVQD
jgi:hypothetical protein